MVGICSQQVIVTDPQLQEPGQGREALRELYGWFLGAFPDLGLELTGPPHLDPAGEAALVPFLLTGTQTGPLDPPGFPPSGRRIELAGVDRWQLAGGELTRLDRLYDGLAMARQIGTVPPPGHPTERFAAAAKRLGSRFRR